MNAALGGNSAPTTLVLSPVNTGALAPGVYSATVQVTSTTAYNSPQAVTVTLGVGTSPAHLTITPTPVDFGQVVVGVTSTPQTMTMSNTGSVATGPLSITNSVGDVGDFFGPVGPSTCLTVAVGGLAAGASCTFSFTFTPTTTGPRSRGIEFSATPGGSATLSTANTYGVLLRGALRDGATLRLWVPDRAQAAAYSATVTQAAE